MAEGSEQAKKAHEQMLAAGRSLQQWLDQIRAQGAADGAPEIKGRKQKTEYARIVGEQAVAAAFRDYEARDDVAFETALKTYAQARARGVGENAALLGSVRDLGAEDIAEFKKVIPAVDQRLEKIGAVTPKRMTEEELLKGLDGLGDPGPEPQAPRPRDPEPAPAAVSESREVSVGEVFANLRRIGQSQEAGAEPAAAPAEPASSAELAPTPSEPALPSDVPKGWHEELGRERGRAIRYIVSDVDPKMRVVRELRPGDEARLAGAFKPQEPDASNSPPPDRKLSHEPPYMDDDDIADRQRRISADSKRRKNDKNKKRRGQRQPDSPPQPGIESYFELGETREEIASKLGGPVVLDEIPYWPLENEPAVVVLDRVYSYDEKPRAYRIGNGGTRHFRSGWYRYDASEKKFLKLSDEKLATLRTTLKRNLIEAWGENGPKQARPDAPRPDVAPDAAAAAGTDDVLQRPRRRPTGRIDGLGYWKERDGSALIEDRENRNRIHRVAQGGLHWVRQGNEGGGDLDREGLRWDGSRFETMTRRAWRNESGLNEGEENENTEGARPQAERETQRTEPTARAQPQARQQTRTPEMPREVNLQRAERAVQRISPDLVAALVEPKVGSEPAASEASAEKERIAGALRRLATSDTEAFERAQRTLTSLSSLERGQYRRVEDEIDRMALREGLDHAEFANMLHEPDPNMRVDMTTAGITHSLGFFGRIWNGITFGLYASAKANRIVSSSLPLAARMKRAEEELGRQRLSLRSILGLT